MDFSAGAWGSLAASDDLDDGRAAPGGRNGCTAAEVACGL
jgi:hypothetical protein